MIGVFHGLRSRPRHLVI